ncbi:MAG TPA: prolyl oligopeptidase family serine peptidase [Sphingobacteriaceae bacterium]|nr:prolyl oligopeptidase family serine peptidase [Sphingobacteriaceae bacterium]
MRRFQHIFFIIILFCSSQSFGQKFKVDDVLGYPFPTELRSSARGSKIAWAFNERGKRNIYVAQGPAFTPVKLTTYEKDDGQEISSLSISADGNWIVYVRGGDHGGNQASTPVNSNSDPLISKVQVWTIPFTGGEPRVLGEGDYPVISPGSDKVVYKTSGGQVSVVPVDGSAPARQLFNNRGSSSGLTWSPDGSSLAFVSSRGTHSFIGIYIGAETPIKWISPAFSKDESPKWSTDGRKIAFIRKPGSGGARDSILARRHQPWAIWTADVASGKASELWKAPETLRGSFPSSDGGANLNWAADHRIVFTSYHDGWPHLYSMPATGGQPLLLTPGSFIIEHVKLSPDKKWLVFSTNSGPDKWDLERRHIARVPVDRSKMEILTPGTGLETYPVITGDGNTLVMLSSTAVRPLLPAVKDLNQGKIQLVGESFIPPSFPLKQMVAPKHITFKAADGTTVYGQLFEPQGGKSKKPAIVYIHGGPNRQMLLGWHHMDYYSIDYALNQYLVNMGFAVLSVNYRLGPGYGYEYNKPANAGNTGASEYQDIKAAGEWLASQPQFDSQRIGIYGGSYGGYLAALALARDSKLFAAGVDIHGVHTRFSNSQSDNVERAPDNELAEKVSYESLPIANLDTWTSPVLLIHGDDDRNVAFSQTVELARRFEQKGFPFEYLAIPDDTHHWMKFQNAVKVSEATADFLRRKLLK